MTEVCAILSGIEARDFSRVRLHQRRYLTTYITATKEEIEESKTDSCPARWKEIIENKINETEKWDTVNYDYSVMTIDGNVLYGFND